MDKEFDSDPVYNEKYLKTKIKSCNGKINTNFHNNQILVWKICLLVILINLFFRTGKNYYPQGFLEECKYVVQEKKVSKYIIDRIEISSNTDEENSDEENSDKENSDEKD